MEDSGPRFEYGDRHEKIDWQKLAALDLQDLLTGNCDPTVLQENLAHVAFCDAAAEFDLRRSGDSKGLLKMFRLSQLTIQYLILSQEFLEEKLQEAQNALDALNLTNKQIKEKLAKQVEECKKMKENQKNMKETIRSLNICLSSSGLLKNMKCPFCSKVFCGKDFLLSHLRRKHKGKNFDVDLLQEVQRDSTNCEKKLNNDFHSVDECQQKQDIVQEGGHSNVNSAQCEVTCHCGLENQKYLAQLRTQLKAVEDMVSSLLMMSNALSQVIQDKQLSLVASRHDNQSGLQNERALYGSEENKEDSQPIDQHKKLEREEEAPSEDPLLCKSFHQTIKEEFANLVYIVETLQTLLRSKEPSTILVQSKEDVNGSTESYTDPHFLPRTSSPRPLAMMPIGSPRNLYSSTSNDDTERIFKEHMKRRNKRHSKHKRPQSKYRSSQETSGDWLNDIAGNRQGSLSKLQNKGSYEEIEERVSPLMMQRQESVAKVCTERVIGRPGTSPLKQNQLSPPKGKKKSPFALMKKLFSKMKVVKLKLHNDDKPRHSKVTKIADDIIMESFPGSNNIVSRKSSVSVRESSNVSNHSDTPRSSKPVPVSEGVSLSPIASSPIRIESSLPGGYVSNKMYGETEEETDRESDIREVDKVLPIRRHSLFVEKDFDFGLCNNTAEKTSLNDQSPGINGDSPPPNESYSPPLKLRPPQGKNVKKLKAKIEAQLRSRRLGKIPVGGHDVFKGTLQLDNTSFTSE